MKNLFLAALAALALSGCASLKCGAKDGRDVAEIDVPEDGWTRYLDTDGEVKEVAFFTAFFSKQFRPHPKEGEKIGFVLTKKSGERIPIRLGNMYKAADGAFSLADLDAEAGVWGGARELRGAKRVKFYKFQEGGVKVTDYEAQRGLCEAFYAGEKIRVKSVLSRHASKAGEASGEISAVQTQGEISRNAVKALNSREKPSPKSSSKNLANKKSAAQKTDSEALKSETEALKNIICIIGKNEVD
ncbi:hypothetical protein [Campylobacter gracilis]|uniref:DUF8095 domain-containing protein n=1 Tax=Campylobacter gracilis RM3268 TaxID=553220 RepID=C8PJ17_9BACT|nr:hypothetical protein [Campylobacter gracilis]AKT92387.1 hypothetical protein CGRAC_0937 [Campylobacter gracilis]EEV16922.1 hypothetical protein CAMGR0001_1216 [Campylobacter gracilis RM3268]UEB45429.1 hypothetical protein LK410_10645 [Campylobacter gracilis]SUW81904.1 Uncharacterised protein [Campylobacter gracilis]